MLHKTKNAAAHYVAGDETPYLTDHPAVLI
jgi:hypothetical protein